MTDRDIDKLCHAFARDLRMVHNEPEFNVMCNVFRHVRQGAHIPESRLDQLRQWIKGGPT